MSREELVIRLNSSPHNFRVNNRLFFTQLPVPSDHEFALPQTAPSSCRFFLQHGEPLVIPWHGQRPASMHHAFRQFVFAGPALGDPGEILSRPAPEVDARYKIYQRRRRYAAAIVASFADVTGLARIGGVDPPQA